MTVRTGAPRPLLTMALLSVMLFQPSGCGGPECEIAAHCPIGEVCSDGQCVAASCRSSLDCGIEEFCSPDTGVCEPGCETDRDCLSYHRCDESGQCVTPGCRSTVLDCAVGEFCNTLTGECFEAGGVYCRSCTVDDDCGGGSNLCLRFSNGARYCGVDCSGGQECPRGFSCARVTDGTGQTVSFQCVTSCWEFE